MALNGWRKANSLVLYEGGGQEKPNIKLQHNFRNSVLVSPSSQLLQQTYHHHHNLLHFANLGMSPKLVALPWCFKHTSSRVYKYYVSNTRLLVRTTTLYQTPVLVGTGSIYQTPVLSCVQALYIKHPSSQTLVVRRVQVLSDKHPSSRGNKYSLSNTRPLVGTSTLSNRRHLADTRSPY
jgi:hypothetical protein